jgi:EAL domain-containing protein (putative c-di-GMP-specific phosphodiesterase class I)
VWAAFKKVKMRKILENTISMFHDINLKVVAEGVEDEEMVNALTQLGVEYLQGYYYSKPLPRTALMDLLQGVNA